MLARLTENTREILPETDDAGMQESSREIAESYEGNSAVPIKAGWAGRSFVRSDRCYGSISDLIVCTRL